MVDGVDGLTCGKFDALPFFCRWYVSLIPFHLQYPRHLLPYTCNTIGHGPKFPGGKKDG